MRKPIQIKRHDTKENHRQQRYEASEKKVRKGKERMNELDLRPLRPHAGGD